MPLRENAFAGWINFLSFRKPRKEESLIGSGHVSLWIKLDLCRGVTGDGFKSCSS